VGENKSLWLGDEREWLDECVVKEGGSGGKRSTS
jgi:hypothetical protein